MIKAIFYKEWLKTKRVVLLLALIALLLVVYTFIQTNYFFRTNEPIQAWLMVIQKDAATVPAIMKWFLPVSAIFLSAAQFSAEVIDKRLKLTLHLPKSEASIISSILLYGVVVLTLLYIIPYIVITFGISSRYPAEIVYNMWSQVVPFMLCGYAAYFLVGWTIVEPIWKQRVCNALISLAALSIFTLQTGSVVNNSNCLSMLVIVVVAFAGVFYSTSRFKDGAQK
jgi:hypothetical protein